MKKTKTTIRKKDDEKIYRFIMKEGIDDYENDYCQQNKNKKY